MDLSLHSGTAPPQIHCEQSQIDVEVNHTQMLLEQERRRLREELNAAERTARQEEAWLRAEAADMLARGWTARELREIGFPQPLLQSLSLTAR